MFGGKIRKVMGSWPSPEEASDGQEVLRPRTLEGHLEESGSDLCLAGSPSARGLAFRMGSKHDLTGSQVLVDVPVVMKRHHDQGYPFLGFQGRVSLCNSCWLPWNLLCRPWWP